MQPGLDTSSLSERGYGHSQSMDEINPQKPLPDLLAFFKVRRGILRRERIAVSVYALSERGCVIKTDEEFVPGDEIRLALSLAMPFDDASTPPLFGHVRSGKKYCSNFFYEINFSGYNKQSAYADIARIRGLLDRKVALTHRRKRVSRAQASVNSSLGSARAERRSLKHAENGEII